MNRKALWVLVAVLALVVAACGDDGGGDETTTTAAAPAETTTTEAGEMTTTSEAMDEIGSEANPIQVLFVPSVSAEEIITGGELLAETLNAETGLFFEVSVPTSYAAVLEEMCASPEDTMGFIPAQAYVLGSDKCGIEVALKSLRFGYTEYWTQFIVARDSEFETIEDLAGASWAYPDGTSTSGFLVPSGIFESMGIEPGEGSEVGSHDAAVQAVYDGTADFGTTFYSPPINSNDETVWDGTAENADVPDDLVDTCALDADGEILCGDDLFPRDARRNIREAAPDVIQAVRILTLSDPIPNDTVSYSPDFPDELSQQINAALEVFAADDPEGFATAFDAYSWSGVATTSDAEFDSIRALLAALGFSEDDL
ncbi:MAG TPA: PhnD/SsuA/transferrin family substrate-binding protein [Acidimicrobiia bacterium]|nr:PhnD/SsuA/transferrin family substrate-binding protein [Acidimicrobiia bacterium]